MVDAVFLVATFNHVRLLPRFFSYIYDLMPKPTLTVFAENNSVDGTLKLIQKFRLPHELIRLWFRRDAAMVSESRYEVIAHVRQLLLTRARQLDPDYGIFLDDDVYPVDPFMVEKLTSHSLDVVGGPYLRFFPWGLYLATVWQDPNGKLRAWDRPQAPLQEVVLTSAGCYDDKTEVYTDVGWKFFRELNGSELILSLNPKNKQLEWLPFIRHISYYLNGTLVHFWSKCFDLMVTLNHNQLFGKKNKQKITKWHLDTVEKMLRHYTFSFPKTAKWAVKKNDKNYISIHELRIKVKTYLKFMGYYLSEGNTTQRTQNGYVVTITQSGNKNKKMYNDLRDMPLKIHRKKDRLTIYDRTLGNYLKQFGKANQKFVPRAIKELPPNLIKTFLLAYLFGDGSETKSGRRIFYTSSKHMAEDIGELILKVNGYPTFLTRSRKGMKCKFRNGVYTINNDEYNVNWNVRKTTSYYRSRKTGLKYKFVSYSGFVYDVELPRNHILWTRRNGKTVFSGNCLCLSRRIIQDKRINFYPLWTDKSAEDFGYCRQARNFGYKIWLDGTVRLKHALRESGKRVKAWSYNEKTKKYEPFYFP